MNLRRVGNTNISVSEIGIGLWSIVTDWWGADINKADEILRRAYELGVNFFDTADVYGEGKGEEIISKTLGTKRDNIIILTKIGIDFYNKKKLNFSIDYLNFAFKQSLKRLNTDYVDILMLHNPKLINIKDKEVFEFLISLKKDGYVRVIGVALGPTLGWGEEGLEAIKMGYESLEYIYNLIERKPGEDFLKYSGIGHFIRVPHANDVLIPEKWSEILQGHGEKLHRALKDINWLKNTILRTIRLKEYADNKGIHLSLLALKFILNKNNVSSVIPNITNIRELEFFLKVEEIQDLDYGDIEFLDKYYIENYADLNDESIRETIKYK
jgi:aryl-alcohol dehydrogenase-like predicted oxidoreductase